MTPPTTVDQMQSIGELLEMLGGISPNRVRLHPFPGTATEQDLLDINDRGNVLCELIDGVLVEKVLGYTESFLAAQIIRLLGSFLVQHNLGAPAGGDGPLRLMSGLVRLPDVSFIRWEKFPDGCLPTEPIPSLAPDLAVEVLSESNTPGEMARKRREYFLAGTELVWEVDPVNRIVTVYTRPDEGTVFTEAETLDGGKVLPGLAISVKHIFERVPVAKSASGKKKRSPRKRKKDDTP